MSLGVFGFIPRERRQRIRLWTQYPKGLLLFLQEACYDFSTQHHIGPG